MKSLVFAMLAVALALPAGAQHLGTSAPAKSDVPARQTLVRDRQGGDTFADAFLIPGVPYEDTGTTLGYADDYDAVCPYAGSTAPDVVYKLQVTSAMYIAIDMCGSGYDTKIYVYREDLTLVACNDDFYESGDECGTYVSKIEELLLDPATKYFVVVDGYGPNSGDYRLLIEEDIPAPPCVVDCPAWHDEDEDEPALGPNYVDNYNGGCNTPGFPFQNIMGLSPGDLSLCGRSGWYLFNGIETRDTDWFSLGMGPTGQIDILVDAEQETYIYELGPQDCSQVDVIQRAIAGPCHEATLTITGYGWGWPVWFWVGPTTFSPPPGEDSEYDYIVWFAGLDFYISRIATEPRTWGDVKSLYR
jgi:hypothetical protein